MFSLTCSGENWINNLCHCTLYTGGLPASNRCCTGLDKNNCKRGLSLRRRGEELELLQANDWIWFFISGSLHLLPRKYCYLWLYLQSEFFSFGCCCCLCLRTFCLWHCPASLVESRQILMRVLKSTFMGRVMLMLLSPPVLFFKQPCLVAVPPSLLWAVEARKQLQALGEWVCRGCLLF